MLAIVFLVELLLWWLFTILLLCPLGKVLLVFLAGIAELWLPLVLAVKRPLRYLDK